MITINSKHIPTDAGIYFFRDRKGHILYVGKAANLKARLSSYRDTHRLDARKRGMLKEAATLSWQKADNEIHALLMEAAEIKKRRPPYNIVLRDDKNYAFVAITNETFPKIFVTHQAPITKNQKLRIKLPETTAHDLRKSSRLTADSWQLKARLLGPFTDAGALHMTLRVLRRIFPFCTCKQQKGHERLCANGTIGKCVGYCCLSPRAREKYTATHDINMEEAARAYQKRVQRTLRILEGKHRAVIKILAKEMKHASRARAYERAGGLRDEIAALERVFAHKPYITRDTMTDRAKALRLLGELLHLTETPNRIEGYDISNIHGNEAVGSMVVFENGVPKKSAYRKFAIKTVHGSNDPAMMREVLTRRFAHHEWPLPDVLLVDGGKPQRSASTAAALSAHFKNPIIALAKREEELYIPLRGELPASSFQLSETTARDLSKARVIRLKEISPTLLTFLQHIRDEAHRFAITYHRKRRTKALRLRSL